VPVAGVGIRRNYGNIADDPICFRHFIWYRPHMQMQLVLGAWPALDTSYNLTLSFCTRTPPWPDDVPIRAYLGRPATPGV